VGADGDFSYFHVFDVQEAMKEKKDPGKDVMDRILNTLAYFSNEELWEILVALAKKKKNGKNGGAKQ
jgi:hypothetical protein